MANARAVAHTDGTEVGQIAEWMVYDSDDNAASTATKAAASGKSHYVCGISAHYDNTAVKKVQLKDGASTVIGSWAVISASGIPASGYLQFETPIKLTAGNAMNCVLDASGTGGTTGYVVVWGYTL